MSAYLIENKQAGSGQPLRGNSLRKALAYSDGYFGAKVQLVVGADFLYIQRIQGNKAEPPAPCPVQRPGAFRLWHVRPLNVKEVRLRAFSGKKSHMREKAAVQSPGKGEGHWRAVAQ